MFKMWVAEGGEVFFSGRFDATQVDSVREQMKQITESCTINFEQLDYISSAGLGILLSVQKRLGESGNALRLINMNRHIRELFRIAGFDQIFEIG